MITREEALDIIRKSALEIADIAPEEIDENSTFESLGLDSLDAIEILCAVEEELDCELDVDGTDMATLSDLLDAIVEGA